VHRQILESLGPHNRVVVAHSLGTVITYEILRQQPEIQVEEFVTVGSHWPGGVVRWTNVAAEGDLATAAAPRLDLPIGDR